MSGDERREIKGAVLLEVEEAKADLALLRAKAERWHKAHEKVYHLLARSRRDSAQLESAAEEARRAIAADLGLVTAVMNLDAVLALDNELQQAVARLKKAEAAKKECFGL